MSSKKKAKRTPKVDALADVRAELGEIQADVRELFKRTDEKAQDGAMAAAAPAAPRTSLDEACRGATFLCQRLTSVGDQLAGAIEQRIGPQPPELPSPVPSRPGIVGRLHDQLAEAHHLVARLERDVARLKSL